MNPLRHVVRQATVTNAVVFLKRYLSMKWWEEGRDLAEMHPWVFQQWLERNAEHLPLSWDPSERSYADGDVDENDISEDVYKEYRDDEMFWSRKVPSEELPSWYYLASPKLYRNAWMLHFTDSPYDVAHYGFEYGVSDHRMLGLTTHLHEAEKESGGYNFAFLADNVPRNAFAYGSGVVLFQASGLTAYHHTDQQWQTIFDGRTAKNIILIEKNRSTSEWYVGEDRTGEPLFSHDELDEVVGWTIDNFNQYKRKLLP